MYNLERPSYCTLNKVLLRLKLVFSHICLFILIIKHFINCVSLYIYIYSTCLKMFYNIKLDSRIQQPYMDVYIQSLCRRYGMHGVIEIMVSPVHTYNNNGTKWSIGKDAQQKHFRQQTLIENGVSSTENRQSHCTAWVWKMKLRLVYVVTS